MFNGTPYNGDFYYQFTLNLDLTHVRSDKTSEHQKMRGDEPPLWLFTP